MPTIRRLVRTTLMLILFSPLPASASLILAAPDGAFPDLSAGVHGTINYTYDAAEGDGLLEIENAPYMFSLGADPSLKFPVSADSDGNLSESLKLLVDSNGKIVPDTGGTPQASYVVDGKVTINGTVYDGPLITGVPVDFGAQDLGAVGINGTDIFDFKIKLTGGLLASYFSATDYLRVQPLVESTFAGKFNQNFVGGVSHSYLNNAYATPEPATWMILVAGTGAIAWGRFRRRNDG